MPRSNSARAPSRVLTSSSSTSCGDGGASARSSDTTSTAGTTRTAATTVVTTAACAYGDRSATANAIPSPSSVSRNAPRDAASHSALPPATASTSPTPPNHRRPVHATTSPTSATTPMSVAVWLCQLSSDQ